MELLVIGLLASVGQLHVFRFKGGHVLLFIKIRMSRNCGHIQCKRWEICLQEGCERAVLQQTAKTLGTSAESPSSCCLCWQVVLDPRQLPLQFCEVGYIYMMNGRRKRSGRMKKKIVSLEENSSGYCRPSISWEILEASCCFVQWMFKLEYGWRYTVVCCEGLEVTYAFYSSD